MRAANPACTNRMPYRAIDRPLGDVSGFRELARLDRTDLDLAFFYIEDFTDLCSPGVLILLLPLLFTPPSFNL